MSTSDLVSTVLTVPESITDHELEAIRASTQAHLDELLGEAGLAGDVVALERIGIALLAAFDAPQSPPELGAVLIDALVDRGCETSIGVLAVLAAFGSETIGRDAAHATRRFDDGPTAITEAVGSLTVREVWQGELPSSEVWVAVLDRPGRDELQAACVTLEVSDEGPIPVEGLLTNAGPVAELDSALSLLAAGTEPSTVAALAERLSDAVANAGKAELAVPLEFGVCLPLLARAIAGRAHALGRVSTYAESDEDQGELTNAEETIEETMLDELVRDYGRYVYATYGGGSAVWRHGEFISCALLDWKRDYRDGASTHWTKADIEEFMLDFAPRKMTMGDEAIRTMPECLAAFMDFLDRDRAVEGDTADALRQTCERLARKSAEACHDPLRWGMAKSFAMQMMSDGLDPADPDACEAWIVARDLRQETQPSKKRAAGSERAKRTAAKQARRRNRS